MDGTLLDLAYDNYFWHTYIPQQYALKHKCSIESTQAQLTKILNEAKGTLNWYCTDFWSEKLSLNIAMLKTHTQHLITLRPDTLNFLSWLKKSPIKTVLLTNAHPDSLKIKMNETGIETFFEHMISSHTFGFAKEEAPFWPLLEKHFKFDKTRTVFIDDNESVLNAAKSYGIGYLYTIHQPDSKEPPKFETIFPAIRNFEHLIPFSD